MADAHTPGPRQAVKGPDPKYAGHAPENAGFVLEADGKTVVGRFPRYEDALLDAAAPDLLAKLIDLESSIAAILASDAKRGPSALAPIWLEEIRAAIAKATGRGGAA